MKIRKILGSILFTLLILVSLFYILSSFNIFPYIFTSQEVLILDIIILGLMLLLIYFSLEGILKGSVDLDYKQISEKSVDYDIIDTKFFENVDIEEPSNLYIGIQNYFRESTNFKELIDKLLVSTSKISKSQKGSILMYNEKKDELYIYRTLGWDKQKLLIAKDIRIKPGEGIAGRVFLDGEPIIMNDLSKLDEFEQREGYKSSAFISYPMYKLDKVIGVLNLTEKSDEKYTDKEINIMKFISNEISAYFSYFLG